MSVAADVDMVLALERVRGNLFTVAVSEANTTPALERLREDVATVAVTVGNEIDPAPCLAWARVIMTMDWPVIREIS